MTPVKKKQSRKASANQHRSTVSLQKTEILINVYDLLPPGRLSSTLWAVGSSLLHSGVVINDKEYAYGGHDRRGMSGVYWTRPKTEPPGGTFKCKLLHGFTFQTPDEIVSTIKEVSDEFLGPSYNLLSRNCNHFTSTLCRKLTSRAAPSWLNRAAGIGLALPCVVPRDWIAPPDHDTAEGPLLDEDDDEPEHARMLPSKRLRHAQHSLSAIGGDNERESVHGHVTNSGWDSEGDLQSGGDGKGKGAMRDTSGRVVPPSERAPTPTAR
ncbi:MAG: hypothetical protein M1833_000778 [Piccolia ochrophora]|nr:MAG: hypothetical protein M1833_000778 [Piccolia ochrophora]